MAFSLLGAEVFHGRVGQLAPLCHYGNQAGDGMAGLFIEPATRNPGGLRREHQLEHRRDGFG